MLYPDLANNVIIKQILPQDKARLVIKYNSGIYAPHIRLLSFGLILIARIRLLNEPRVARARNDLVEALCEHGNVLRGIGAPDE